MDSIVDIAIVAPCVLGLLWSAKECLFLKNIKMDGHQSGPRSAALMKADQLGEDPQRIVSVMQEIAGYISEGATAFLWKEYQYHKFLRLVFVMSASVSHVLRRSIFFLFYEFQIKT